MEIRESISNQTDVALGISKHLLLTEGKDSNLVFSPLSIHVVLSLVAAGSKGSTLDQFLSFLKSKSVDHINSFLKLDQGGLDWMVLMSWIMWLMHARAYNTDHQSRLAASMMAKGCLLRWDFETQEEWATYNEHKEAMPKAAFQFGVKMQDGQNTQKQNRDQKLNNELHQINKILTRKR
uniref:Serpin domain-containing protein n=1 Tax=Quercus lobata TaxID=97700 RepID=A0A7N2LWB1_QUELO